MTIQQVDLVVIGGGINGAGVARDAAGRGLSVLLAERHDYAGATSSNSSKLIHGGLRYLETFELGLVREALREREVMLRIAPHITEPIRFLLPIGADAPRPTWMLRLGLWLYDMLAGHRQLQGSGRLSAREVTELPHLRSDRYHTVLHYPDVLTDDARLVLETLLDARSRGADVRNYCEVKSVHPETNGYKVTLCDAEGTWSARTRYLVNAAGPWTNHVRKWISDNEPGYDLRLVRGSHIVLPMPRPALVDAITLQRQDGRVVFLLPWLERFLIVGTTEVPQDDPDDEIVCTEAERDYLLAAANEVLDLAAGTDAVTWSWSGVRPLVDDESEEVSKTSRGSMLDVTPNGRGGCVTIYGGKITTYRRLAERVMDSLAGLGADMTGAWTADAPLYNGGLTRDALSRLAEDCSQVPRRIAHRWAFTYGDATRDLMQRVSEDPALGREVADGVPLVELEHAWSAEDARCATDFLERRTKLRLILTESDRELVARWFADRANVST
ncbi:MAG: Aerobic glycerol-3-phosphate dehydrogenase [Gammaproteobacteria bacterium]|nr:Aerobic glycerol-3-phosphate dehydrogenase [Gammaproteobacteria bacterium]